MAFSLIKILRRFLPDFLRSGPKLARPQWRAIRAITQCRTPALGGQRFVCEPCGTTTFVYHSCNHKACPQCGRDASAQWVERELSKRILATYFLVTFTLPSELRSLFFGKDAKEAYDLFFSSAAAALQDCLANPKWLGATTSGFTAVLHTWNQQLLFHPHLHVIVPAAGIDRLGNVIFGKHEKFLVPLPALRSAFRHHFREGMRKREWGVDPVVWHTDWGIHIQPVGSGASAIKYLGTYVRRTAISEHRILNADDSSVTFAWEDRAHGNATKRLTLSANEFMARYLRHALPAKLHSTRYYGWCHPAARRTRERIAFHSGRPLFAPAPPPKPDRSPKCPCCQKPMEYDDDVKPLYWLMNFKLMAWSRVPVCTPIPKAPT